jgi:hypothetical protein
VRETDVLREYRQITGPPCGPWQRQTSRILQACGQSDLSREPLRASSVQTG